jgi:hypothetical protein
MLRMRSTACAEIGERKLMPKLVWLADVFRAKGIAVVEEPEWKKRGRAWKGPGGLPEGGVQHHTAPPVPFPVKGLYPKPLGTLDKGRIKCNWNVKQDGTLHLIAAGACNFSTGPGSSVVLEDVKADKPPSGTAISRQLMDDMDGNPFFLNNETDHPGDGSPIPDAQYRTVVLAWVAICEKLGWPPAKVIAHGEWTRRKPDPAWNGKNPHENLQIIRADIAAALQGGPGVLKQDSVLSNGMFNEEPCQVLGPDLIRQLFAARPDDFAGDPAFWADCKAPREEWPDFWRAYLKAVGKKLANEP